MLKNETKFLNAIFLLIVIFFVGCQQSKDTPENVGSGPGLSLENGLPQLFGAHDQGGSRIVRSTTNFKVPAASVGGDAQKIQASSQSYKVTGGVYGAY